MKLTVSGPAVLTYSGTSQKLSPSLAAIPRDYGIVNTLTKKDLAEIIRAGRTLAFPLLFAERRPLGCNRAPDISPCVTRFRSRRLAKTTSNFDARLIF
jgi:hypothetical protein